MSNHTERALARPLPRKRSETEPITFGVSQAVVRRLRTHLLARRDTRQYVPTVSELVGAAFADLPHDVQEMLELVKSAPRRTFEGGREQLAARVPHESAHAIRRLPEALRAADARGTLAWHVLAAALSRQLDAEERSE